MSKHTIKKMLTHEINSKLDLKYCDKVRDEVKQYKIDLEFYRKLEELKKKYKSV